MNGHKVLYIWQKSSYITELKIKSDKERIKIKTKSIHPEMRLGLSVTSTDIENKMVKWRAWCLEMKFLSLVIDQSDVLFPQEEQTSLNFAMDGSPSSKYKNFKSRRSHGESADQDVSDVERELQILRTILSKFNQRDQLILISSVYIARWCHALLLERADCLGRNLRRTAYHL